MVRTKMKKLAEEGKITISTAPKDSRADKIYSLK